MNLDITEWLIAGIVLLIFIILCVLTVKEFRSKREHFTKRSYIYFGLLALYLVIVWNVTPTDFSLVDMDWFSF